MLILRPYASGDIDALYAVSLATADVGADASRLYHDKQLVGSIYSAPYAALDPDLVVVAADEEGVGGFVLGAIDTVTWEERWNEAGGRDCVGSIPHPTRKHAVVGMQINDEYP